MKILHESSLFGTIIFAPMNACFGCYAPRFPGTPETKILTTSESGTFTITAD
ncbi:MAG: hypothetical protein U1D26_03945 [Patescibacteria group bacterium]|nr:hypothetical protein [bacterium]MDZ4227602.1 hypothetical protein [Patescibacteria group bacterium]